MTRARKRKMEALIGGDNCKAHESCSSAKQSKQSSSPKSAHNVCMQSDAASGDSSSTDVCHQQVTILRDLDSEDARPGVHIQCCDLGDVWSHQYPIPLSSYPSYDIKTGNSYYDAIIPELHSIGYKPLQIIAKGRSGTVIMAQDLHPEKIGSESEYRPVALKLNTGKKRKHRTNRVDVTDEMLIHQTLVHPNIVRMFCPLSYQGRGGLVLEFCESGNLEMLLKSQDARFLTEPICRKYFVQILNALEYVHLSGYAHRDVCPQNILVSNENTLKLTDFGHAVKFTAGDDLCEDNSGGTLGYQAPEVVCKVPYNPKLADMWSLGAVLYTMSVGKLPFGRLKTEEMARNIKRLSCPEAHVMILTNEIKELMDGLLAYVPEARYSLNRCRHCDWASIRETRVQIGNFYLVRQPQKIFEGDREKEIKRNYEI